MRIHQVYTYNYLQFYAMPLISTHYILSVTKEHGVSSTIYPWEPPEIYIQAIQVIDIFPLLCL